METVFTHRSILLVSGFAGLALCSVAGCSDTAGDSDTGVATGPSTSGGSGDASSGETGGNDDGGDTGAPIECVPGDTRCSDDWGDIEVCDDEGHWQVSLCGDDEACKYENGEPTCYSTLDCQPGDVVCYDDTNYLPCTESGEWGAPVPCGFEMVCDPAGTSEATICTPQVFGVDYELFIDDLGGIDCYADPLGDYSEVFVEVWVQRVPDSEGGSWGFEGSFPVDTCPVFWAEGVVISNVTETTWVDLRVYDEDVSDHDLLGGACKTLGDPTSGVCYSLDEGDLAGGSLYWERTAWADVRLVKL